MKQLKLEVVNLVATARLNQSVDLEKLIFVEGFLYDEAIYHCAYLRDSQMKTKVSIFASGKMICIGAKSLAGAKRDLEHAAGKLASIGLIKPVRLKPRIENIVAFADLERPIDLEHLSKTYPDIIYDPQQFAGAICHSRELRGASILVFASGKAVVAGLREHALLGRAKQVLESLGRTTY